MAQRPRTVTALRADRGGRVAVELDGGPWRTLPLEPVLRAGLAAGVPLDRPRARTLARELRRTRSLAVAARALRHRDLPTRALDARLSRGGVAPAARREAIATLERAGAVDDARYAASRAGALAARGYGDAAIRWELEQRGIAGETVCRSLASLEPESLRARRLFAARGGDAAAARSLARRGFGEEAIEAVLAEGGADDPGKVG